MLLLLLFFHNFKSPPLTSLILFHRDFAFRKVYSFAFIFWQPYHIYTCVCVLHPTSHTTYMLRGAMINSNDKSIARSGIYMRRCCHRKWTHLEKHRTQLYVYLYWSPIAITKRRKAPFRAWWMIFLWCGKSVERWGKVENSLFSCRIILLNQMRNDIRRWGGNRI